MSDGVDSTRLRSFIERIEKLEEQKKNLAEDLKEVYGEAKAAGYETKALKQVVKLLQISENPKLKNKMDEEQYWLETYKTALGLE
ncbi:MAG: hypothetical protein BWY78_00520 [Alphaproteobacteria bacterium ADurb.Bin438]|nr:MAG: hypothetical protein BWY78_00520 [Alphaproteobacteria bacterium ADurb.Bin438]